MHLAGIALLLLQAAAGQYGTKPCKGSPEVVAACYVVHGRLSDWNGNPTLRIWPVGTKRMLGVREGYSLPANISGCVGWGKHQNLYANFLVCPLAPEQAGHMRPVCVESAEAVVLERFEDEGKEKVVEVKRLPQEGCASK